MSHFYLNSCDLNFTLDFDMLLLCTVHLTALK